MLYPLAVGTMGLFLLRRRGKFLTWKEDSCIILGGKKTALSHCYIEVQVCAEVPRAKLSSQRSGPTRLLLALSEWRVGMGFAKMLFFASWHIVTSEQERALRGCGGGIDLLFLVLVYLTRQAPGRYTVSSTWPLQSLAS